MPSPILAKALQSGATIAFISPSARLNDAFAPAVSRAATLFSSKGYKVNVLFTPDTGIQSSISNRLEEIRSAFLDPTVSAIICTIGGESFTELLPALIADKDLQTSIRADPKIVVGLSDNTGLHWFLHAFTGLRTFYGPSAIVELGTTSSADDPTSPLAFCVQSLIDVIAKPEPLGIVPRSASYAPKLPAFFQDPASTQEQMIIPTSGWAWLRPGKAQGRLFGGCLPVVARLNGVKAIVPDWRGRIVFLETSVGEADDLDRVRTGFADLIAQGVFEEAAGLVVGRPCGYDSEKDQEDYTSVIKELLCEGRFAREGSQFPILFNIDIGHTTPMVTLPFDALALMDSESDRFVVLEPGVVL